MLQQQIMPEGHREDDHEGLSSALSLSMRSIHPTPHGPPLYQKVGNNFVAVNGTLTSLQLPQNPTPIVNRPISTHSPNVLHKIVHQKTKSKNPTFWNYKFVQVALLRGKIQIFYARGSYNCLVCMKAMVYNQSYVLHHFRDSKQKSHTDVFAEINQEIRKTSYTKDEMKKQIVHLYKKKPTSSTVAIPKPTPTVKCSRESFKSANGVIPTDLFNNNPRSTDDIKAELSNSRMEIQNAVDREDFKAAARCKAKRITLEDELKKRSKHDELKRTQAKIHDAVKREDFKGAAHWKEIRDKMLESISDIDAITSNTGLHDVAQGDMGGVANAITSNTGLHDVAQGDMGGVANAITSNTGLHDVAQGDMGGVANAITSN
eukprot:160354_1